mgnify:CR=1 FL=1
MLILQDWVVIAEQINCPAPLPEDPELPLLTKMLFLAPYQAPEKKAKKEATGARKSSRFQVLSDDESEADSSHQGEEEKKKASPPAGEGKKRKASPTGEAEGSKKGKTLLPDYASDADDGEEEWPSRAKPLVKS